MANGTEYAVISAGAIADGDQGGDGTASITERLGCTELRVAAWQLSNSDAVDFRSGYERVVLPLRGDGTLELDGRFPIPRSGLARLPPNRPCTVEVDGDVTALVVSAATETDGTEPTILDLDAVEYVVPSTSDVATAHLTTPLGCSGMKTNARLLEPGQKVPYHVEGTQEELFVPLDDGAAMRVGDRRFATSRGMVVRVPPSTPRSAVNDAGTSVRWMMFGAPPTGGPTDWDPGATILE